MTGLLNARGPAKRDFKEQQADIQAIDETDEMMESEEA